ncbi:MAG: MBL fold metallo-hydrolase [Saprospiraceae bacterium]|nr:MBL fold metallo-hydrolase [Saprospiraceae bacterium]
MKIKFCGAAQEVTGSSHLITLDDGFKILLDCGLYQGGGDDDGKAENQGSPLLNFNKKWLFPPHTLDCLILSHAHIDHTGRVPKLVADGFSGKIYSTHATRDLCSIMLLDSAKIQEGDADRHNRHKHFDDPEARPLYTIGDVQATMRQFASYNYEQWFHVHPNVRVLFRDMGHILGSASVTLEITENGKKTTFGFTGDIGRPNRPILGDPLPLPKVDYLICESTYGDREHESAPQEIDQFVEVIRHTCLEKKGKVIIPAFSVGRTQEIVYMLDKLQHAGRLPYVPVYVDSPLAVNATEVFIKHPECFDNELHRYMADDENPFGFNNLYYIRNTDGSKQLNSMRKPAIIISASGMMNAGRIRHHLLNNIENRRNTFLIVGYCAPNTPGGQLRAGAKSLMIMGQYKQVLADIVIMDSFSAHGDRSEMLDVIANQKGHVKKIWLTHGTLDRQEKWREYLQANGFPNIGIPALGEEETLG